MNNKIIFSIYLLLICFVSMCVIMISSTSIIQNSIHLIAPSYSRTTQYNNNEDYKQSLSKEKLESLTKTSEEDITQKRLNHNEGIMKEIQHNAIAGIIDSIPSILISFIVFLIHWKIYMCCRRKEWCCGNGDTP